MPSVWVGLMCGLAAGAFWGASFLIPKLFPGLSPGDLALARSLGFASLSFFVLWRQRQMRIVGSAHWPKALVLSLASCSLYYFVLSYSIRLAGALLASLISGLLPLTISIASQDRVARPRQFRLSLALIFAGVAVLNMGDLFVLENEASRNAGFILGFLLSIVALGMWTSFAVQNGRFLKAHSEISSSTWAACLGIYAFISVLPLTAIEHLGPGSLPFPPAGADYWKSFLLAACLLGFGCSFMASLLWNRASQRLPTALLGQLIVSETLFALLYAFAYEKRLPSATEALSIVLLITGVTFGIRSFLEPKKRFPELSQAQ